MTDFAEEAMLQGMGHATNDLLLPAYVSLHFMAWVENAIDLLNMVKMGELRERNDKETIIIIIIK